MTGRTSGRSAAPSRNDRRVRVFFTNTGEGDSARFKRARENSTRSTAVITVMMTTRARANCTEIKLEAWRKRGLWHKFKDNAYYLLNEIM